jgi:hypothetical protein
MSDGLTQAMNPLSGASDSGTGSVPGPQVPLAQNPPLPAAPSLGNPTPSGNMPANALSGAPAGPDPSAMKHVSKLASIGHVFNTLAGTSNEYSIDPQTGQTVATPVKQKPGQMFRNMLAGALMGGAAGAGAGDPTAGFVKGGAAVIGDQRQQDLVKRGQAQEQFKNQLASNEENRKQQEFNTNQEYMKAQIAHANISVVRENQLIQNENFDFHTKAANWGKAQFDAIANSGVKPVYRDVPESEMNDMLKNSPGSSTLKWYATGVKNSIGADGKPTYEETYSAINPTDKVKLTPALLDSWKEAGLDKYFPDVFNQKSGYELNPQDFVSISQRAHDLMLDKLAQGKLSAETDEAIARGKQATAAAAKDYAERDNYLEGKNKAGAFNKALKNLNDKGSFDKLDAGDKLVLGESASKALDGAVNAYKAAKANGDEEAASSALRDYDFYGGLVKQSFGASPSKQEDDVVNKAMSFINTLPYDQQVAAINNSQKLTPEQKKVALSKLKAPAPYVNPALSEEEKKKAAAYRQQQQSTPNNSEAVASGLVPGVRRNEAAGSKEAP